MIELKSVSKIYNYGTHNEVVALSDVSFKLERGKIIALTGPSGCGKTTLLSIISLILTPTSGQVLYDGEDVLRNSDQYRTNFRRDNFGFIFQHINLLPNYTALDNVLLPLYSLDRRPEDYAERARNLFNEFGISTRINSPVEQLSGGEQQRVACIRALIKEPPYLFADEPTVFVDEASSRIIENVFVSLREKGNTILLSTHDQDLLKIADETIRLCKGNMG